MRLRNVKNQNKIALVLKYSLDLAVLIIHLYKTFVLFVHIYFLFQICLTCFKLFTLYQRDINMKYLRVFAIFIVIQCYSDVINADNVPETVLQKPFLGSVSVRNVKLVTDQVINAYKFQGFYALLIRNIFFMEIATTRQTSKEDTEDV